MLGSLKNFDNSLFTSFKYRRAGFLSSELNISTKHFVQSNLDFNFGVSPEYNKFQMAIFVNLANEYIAIPILNKSFNNKIYLKELYGLLIIYNRLWRYF